MRLPIVPIEHIFSIGCGIIHRTQSIHRTYTHARACTNVEQMHSSVGAENVESAHHIVIRISGTDSSVGLWIGSQMQEVWGSLAGLWVSHYFP